MRTAARRLLCLILLAGCASEQGRIALPATDDPAALARAECAVSVTPGDGSEAVRVGVEQGALASLYLVLRGAADGALIGAIKGAGGAADGAWIGAAGGAGLGLIVGVVVGVGKSLEDHRRYRAMYEACVAWRAGEGER
jgi:hypothetical protein